jgi:hypothetical protein
MDTLFIAIFIGGFLVAGFRWISSIEAASLDDTNQLKHAENVNVGNTYTPDITRDDCAPINPATGLPMVGLFDMSGNPFGHSNTSFNHGSVNPTTGLPMVGMVDTGGNAYGSGTYHH